MSDYTTSFIVFPEHCNHLKELIFGGAFMSQLDLAAAHCVRRVLFASPTATNAVTHKATFEFVKPCYVGDLIDLDADVVSTHKKSLVVCVAAFRNVKGVKTLVAKAQFVFIAVGDVSNLTNHPEYLPYVEHGV